MAEAHHDETVPRHRPGAPVALRSVNTFGAHGEAVGFAVAGRVLVDDDELAVVASPTGSAMRRRAGRGSGPNARLVLPDDWDGSYGETSWSGPPVVRVHRRGTRWSVWRWHDGADWLPDWYVNLELPWRRTAIGFDSQDWTLDVIVRTMPDGSWSVQREDEDELEFYASQRLWPAAMRTVIEEAGAAAVADVRADRFPFRADWSAWVPDPAWPAPDLPPEWSVLGR